MPSAYCPVYPNIQNALILCLCDAQCGLHQYGGGKRRADEQVKGFEGLIVRHVPTYRYQFLVPAKSGELTSIRVSDDVGSGAVGTLDRQDAVQLMIQMLSVTAKILAACS